MPDEQSPRDELEAQQQQMDEDEDELNEAEGRREIHGLLVSYKDDEINDCVQAALEGKRRVHYKCADVYANFVALGTSVGAIYLFRLTTITHASCELALNHPCDQGSIEAIRFLPVPLHSNGLLVAIGTSRGSLVVFQLSSLADQKVRVDELYRAEQFTCRDQQAAAASSSSLVRIKLIEYDLDLFNSYLYLAGGGVGGSGVGANHLHSSSSSTSRTCAFSKLYICDQNNRVFVLDSRHLFAAFRLQAHKPKLFLSVEHSTIHQISVHRSQLLVSTDLRTRIFREHLEEEALVPRQQQQQRKRGFFGACFFNYDYKPPRMLPGATSSSAAAAAAAADVSASQPSIYSSTSSLMELEKLSIFVARPHFCLWQANASYRRQVLPAHNFEPALRSCRSARVLQLDNQPVANFWRQDDAASLTETLLASPTASSANDTGGGGGPRSDHFEKLVQIFSQTLGNLLLSYTRHEIFILDPVRARLLAWYQHAGGPILQVCANENELFVLSESLANPNNTTIGNGANSSSSSSSSSRRQLKLERLVLLAPTQFILELHRLNRLLSLMAFMQTFCAQMCQLMALPLNGPGTITTEGGLLRNIVWNTWRECSNSALGPAERRRQRRRQRQRRDQSLDGERQSGSSASSAASSSSTLDGHGEDKNSFAAGAAADDDDNDAENDNDNDNEHDEDDETGAARKLERFGLFKGLIDEIVRESEQLERSFENLAGSQFLARLSSENYMRLRSEPYASLVSLDVDITDLHTNHVIHFSQRAAQRHKSLASLAQQQVAGNPLKRALTQPCLHTDAAAAAAAAAADGAANGDRLEELRNSTADLKLNETPAATNAFNDKRVVVERLRPKRPFNAEEQKQVVVVERLLPIHQETEAETKTTTPPPPHSTTSTETTTIDKITTDTTATPTATTTTLTTPETTIETDWVDEETRKAFNVIEEIQENEQPNADIRWAIGKALEQPVLLNESEISAKFYLQAIAFQCAVIRRTRLKVR